jgi:hypothetical protein
MPERAARGARSRRAVLAGALGLPALAACAVIDGLLNRLPQPTPPVTFAVTHYPTATPEAASTPTVSPVPPPAPTPGLAWRALRPGIELAQGNVEMGGSVDWLTLVRIAPAQAVFRVRYAPGAPLRVRAWQAATGSRIVINAGFFTADHTATGLLIADGQVHGRSYTGFGGMFSVRDGQPALRWLATQPYRPDQRITQAVQSFPMLAHDGGAISSIPEDGSRNRRSFIAVDRQARVVMGVTTAPIWTLTGLAAYLVEQSGLDLSEALNLDGGASSGLWIAEVPEISLVDSIDGVPAVITVDDVGAIGAIGAIGG